MIRADARDVALLRQIVAWRKAAGYDLDFSNARYRVPGGPWIGWERHDVTGHPEPIELGLHSGVRGDGIRRVRVIDLTEAVDVAVAFGYLPPRFSSAYRAGWNAQHESRRIACRDGIGSPGLSAPEVVALWPVAGSAW